MRRPHGAFRQFLKFVKINGMIKKRVILTVSAVLTVMVLLGSGFFLGYRMGRKVPENIVVTGVGNIDSGKPVDTNFGIFWETWKNIDDQYLRNDKVDNKKKVYGAVKGLVESLGDQYSEFFSPEDGQKFQQDVQGNFGGIGAELGAKNSQVVIITPLKNTPASKAGLQPGDKILFVDSSSTISVSVDQVVKWIRGPVGKPVVLTISRDGFDKPKEFKITREVITIPTLEEERVGNNISHVKLYSFNGNANALLYDAVLKMINNPSRGMILDLRNDPGGFLEVAVDLAGWFLPRGSLVVSQEGRGGLRNRMLANGNAVFKDFPLVILVNEGSASAAEILAGAIRADRGDVKLVGKTTFGKGTVQQLENLSDGSSIKLTVAHWILPDGKILEGKGLSPDVEIKNTEADAKNGKDPQLAKAIEVLEKEINKKQ